MDSMIKFTDNHLHALKAYQEESARKVKEDNSEKRD